MYMEINTKLWEKVPTSNILCSFSLINGLVACMFTFLFWFRKHSGHIFCCYFLEKCGNQVDRRVRHLPVYVLMLLLSFPFQAQFLSVILSSFFSSFSTSIFFPYVDSKTGSARVPKSFI